MAVAQPDSLYSLAKPCTCHLREKGNCRDKLEIDEVICENVIQLVGAGERGEGEFAQAFS